MSIDFCNISVFVIYDCIKLDLVLVTNQATASHGPTVRMHRWYGIHLSLFRTQTMRGQELIAILRMEARARIIGFTCVGSTMFFGHVRATSKAFWIR